MRVNTESADLKHGGRDGVWVDGKRATRLVGVANNSRVPRLQHQPPNDALDHGFNTRLAVKVWLETSPEEVVVLFELDLLM